MRNTHGPAPSRLRRLLRGLGVSLGALLVLLVAGEIAVRLLCEAPARYEETDALLGKRYVPGWEGVVFNDESGRSVTLRFNRHGFRFPDLPEEKPADTRRIVFLGDSMIAAEQVEEEESAPVLLEQELDAVDDEREWEVLNFGVSGAGTGQEYVLYREMARRYRPDVVLCAFFVGNDFGDNSKHFSLMRHPRSVRRLVFDLDEQGNLVQEPYPPLDLRMRDALSRYSLLYSWQKQATWQLKQFLFPETVEAADPLAERHGWHGDSVRASEWIYCTEEDEAMSHCWAITAAAIEALAAEVAKDGAVFALVVLPSSEQVHDEEFDLIRSVAGPLADAFDPRHPNRRLGAICADLGVSCFDLLPDFRAAAPSHSELAEDEWLFLNGRGHFNPQGHALVAQAIARRLANDPRLE